MKYEQKSFSSGPNSKLYRDNWDKVFKGYVDVEIDIDQDIEIIINKYAEDNGLTFNDAIIQLLHSQLDELDNKEKCETAIKELADQNIKKEI